ncbi:tetratricopeptide repeat protein [Actinoplanes sp. NEAU-A12]|uniref:Tetratricopeptide repeat protein n=1 Tax=Actinoplanes sandaracinus TaxID=3045177 RepID=A0ABT6WGI6_9ACTN|nr:helix-turn-helix domain-containing protein [Actinoplanes sandaracinus]MDI6098827.1 tetratricopeptide repeat protein [Actinoplanes sandaracinus]
MPTEDASLSDLGEALRELRRRQARRDGERQLTYRELAERTGWSHGIIGEYFAGRVLPPTDRFDLLIRLLGATPAEQGALATLRDQVEEQRRRGDQRPRELPAAGSGMVGRDAELSELDAMLTGNAPVVISGMAGIGKTTLALHWAHRIAARFPDGQLHLNLHGFHPEGAMSAGEALNTLLSSLGVAAPRIPQDLEARAGLYRTLLQDRRMLVMLDNAADAEQVRPLLPPAGCLALVTSRGQLTGLVVSEGARPLSVDVLAVDDARRLLAERLGAGRVERDAAAVERIVTACGRLPLALAVVAARGALNPAFSLDDIAGELDGSGATSATETLADVRTAFSWSYRLLRPDARRLFRLIGLHPGPDLTAPTAAALGGLGVTRAAAILAELAQARLTVEHRPGRFACHDLLRAYAGELSESEDPAADRRAAVDRLLTHLVHAAGATTLVLDPLRKPIGIPAGEPPATVTRPADEVAAMGWFRAEHRALLAALDLAVRTGLDRQAWRLAWGVVVALERDGGWQDWIAVQTTALRAAERLGDPAASAFSHRSLSVGYARLGRTAESRAHALAAYELFLQVDDPAGAAVCQHALAFTSETEGRWAEAITHAERALALFRRAHDPVGQARALNSAGLYQAELGDHDAALDRCGQALRLQLGMGDLGGAAATLDSLGTIRHQLGDHPAAIGHFREALALFARQGDRIGQADTLGRLGETQRAAGDVAAVRQSWQQAVTLLEEIGHPGLAGARARLAALDRQS